MLRRTAVLTAAVVAAALLAGPGTATAASPPGLAVSVPGTVSLGTVTAGGTLSASLGTVQVSTGGSIGLSVAWTATVSTSGFTGPGGAVVPPGSVSYTAGVASASGIALSACAPGAPGSLASARTAYGCSGLLLSLGTTVTWTPSLSITVGTQALAGTYSGTVTHSVT